tara:strand:+ start:411 stop:539 length:129 start_codon:yes stop_codon:yes gene_type:complete
MNNTEEIIEQYIEQQLKEWLMMQDLEVPDESEYIEEEYFNIG